MKINLINISPLYYKPGKANVSFKSNSCNDAVKSEPITDIPQFKATKFDATKTPITTRIRNFFKNIVEVFSESYEVNSQYQGDIDQFVAERVFLL